MAKDAVKALTVAALLACVALARPDAALGAARGIDVVLKASEASGAPDAETVRLYGRDQRASVQCDADTVLVSYR